MLYRRLFVKDLEELNTRLTHSSFVVITSSHPVLGETGINSMHFMVTDKLNHQESGTENLHDFTSITAPLLTKEWFQNQTRKINLWLSQ